MRIVSRAAGVVTLLALLSFSAVSTAGAAQQSIGSPVTTSTQRLDAAGAYVAAVFFDTLRTRDVGSQKCEFVVQGQLTFTGTLQGVAEGTTTALIHAPCAEATDPRNLGAFRDVFRFEGTFAGTVEGVPTTGDLSYAGVTRPGGAIDATIKLRSDSAKAALHTVTAQLGVGGTYRGVVVIPSR